MGRVGLGRCGWGYISFAKKEYNVIFLDIKSTFLCLLLQLLLLQYYDSFSVKALRI